MTAPADPSPRAPQGVLLQGVLLVADADLACDTATAAGDDGGPAVTRMPTLPAGGTPAA
ncbi:hypothetical protein tb265_47410 [Gemmatimonadetes bacterium T265]|nr:hypothetical protein tb265_47410 [Gemmatimonadetes bacterium T265]